MLLAKGLLYGAEIVERQMGKALNQRFEALLNLWICSCRECSNGAAMETVLKDNDFRPIEAPVVTMQTRQFQGGLVGFEPRVTKECIGHTRE